MNNEHNETIYIDNYNITKLIRNDNDGNCLTKLFGSLNGRPNGTYLDIYDYYDGYSLSIKCYEDVDRGELDAYIKKFEYFAITMLIARM